MRHHTRSTSCHNHRDRHRFKRSRSHSHSHRYRITARAIHREVTAGHITDAHTGAHLTTYTQTHIIINRIQHTGDLHHTEALPHILEITVGQDHITHTKLPLWHPPNPPTALAGQPGKTRIRNTNKSLDEPPSNYYSSDEPSSESDEDLN